MALIFLTRLHPSFFEFFVCNISKPPLLKAMLFEQLGHFGLARTSHTNNCYHFHGLYTLNTGIAGQLILAGFIQLL